MNEVIKTILERRSIRQFKPDMVEQEKINEIINAGLYAPSGMGKQSTIILEVTDKTWRNKFKEANAKIGCFKEGMDPFYGAPVILVVLAEKDSPTGIYDGSLAMENMMLAAESLGLGSIWIHRAKEEFELPEFKQLLKENGILNDYIGIGHCAVGYIEGEKPLPAKRKENRVFYIK